MNTEHVLSDAVFKEAEIEFRCGNYWIAYNIVNYFLGEGDIYFFNSEPEAKTFAEENISDYDHYCVIYASSIVDLLRQLPYGKSIEDPNNIDKSLKANFMNLDNVNYLKDNLKYMGFGDKLHADLEKNIQQGFPEFVLKMQSEFSGQKMESILFFKKSEQSDLYFFNKYDAVLGNDVGTFEHSFYLNKGHGVTLKEAFNLLQGRAVHKEMESKEGQKYGAWIELDFKQKENGSYKVKQYHDNYGYDLEATIKNFPIKELGNEQQKERLLSSLQRGNRQSVTMTVEGREQMFFVQANPQFKTLTVFDKGATRPLTHEQKTTLLVMPAEERTKINGQAVPGNSVPEVRQIENKNVAEVQNAPAKDKTEKKSVTEEQEKRGKERGKKEAVKDLLPQKQKTVRGKGLRA